DRSENGADFPPVLFSERSLPDESRLSPVPTLAQWRFSMFVHQLPLFALACVVVLGFTLTAQAGDRDMWRHSKGAFMNSPGSEWVEKAPDGATYYFKERTRTEEYVLHHDASRDCFVRLNNDHCPVKFGSGRYEEYYRGRWN